VPLYKAKGTIYALAIALSHIGVKLTKITNLWQVVSEHIWTDGFLVDVNKPLGRLTKVPYKEEYEVFLRTEGGLASLYKDCINIQRTPDYKHMVHWNNNEIQLFDKDVVLIKYKIKDIPTEKQSVEDYIQSLPLADSRDETKQSYPLKNWNVRLIEEDDPLFDVVIPTRYPAYDPVVFGKVRTTFMYSEKAYNMDTYDGSLRDSKSPGDIDREFMDNCSYCQSSKFNIDIETDELSEDKMHDIMQVVKEYSPFHAVLHSVNAVGDFEMPNKTIMQIDGNKIDFNYTRKNSELFLPSQTVAGGGN
jgi:hypothetical protein